MIHLDIFSNISVQTFLWENDDNSLKFRIGTSPIGNVFKSAYRRICLRIFLCPGRCLAETKHCKPNLFGKQMGGRICSCPKARDLSPAACGSDHSKNICAQKPKVLFLHCSIVYFHGFSLIGGTQKLVICLRQASRSAFYFSSCF